jgi:pSer/pThr/pTyr-binding forkhead associated (FHA) protein
MSHVIYYKINYTALYTNVESNREYVVMVDYAVNPEKPDTIPERNISTRQLDTSQFNPELREKLTSVGEANKSSERELVLFFPNRTEPFHFVVDGTLTIGRADTSTRINPTIDLTPYFGTQLGVSRFHAEIMFTNGRFHLKDMGSTNSSRINGKKISPYRLVPFRSGDEIRLGHFTMIVG